MDNTRIITVRFGKERIVVTEYRMQHDWGQVLDFVDIPLPEAFEARFSNSVSGQSVGQIGYNNRVRIPKQFFESGEPIYCYVTVHDEETDGRTLYTTKVPIKPSSERTEEEPEPEEESIITQAITALNTAVDVTSQKALEASESADRAEHAADGIEAYAERAEAAQNAAESARDIALEAKVSAQTSAATASEKASEAISSATTASQSALTAENASESAQANAEASYQNAETAYRYAQDSAISAGQAGESAQTASQKATEASQKASEASASAQTALQAKTDAETAKTASETAQGLAESARDEAVSAKTGAESARDEAQEIVDGITVRAEQIVSNTERIESLEDDRYKPYPTDTASGAVASFPDGADNIPLKSCIVQIEPVQAGSGDPSPDNVRPISGWTGCEVQRTGKNLLSLDESEMVSNGWNRIFPISLKAGTYIISCQNQFGASAKGAAVVLVDDNATTVIKWLSGYEFGDSMFVGRATTITEEEASKIKNLRFSLRASGTTYNDIVQGNIKLELGSTATEYEPYQGETYPITFPTEAGTIYGGYVDVINGELVVDRAIVDLGTVSWTSMDNVQYCFASTAIVCGQAYPTVFCDTYASASNYNDVKDNNGKIGVSLSRTLLHDNRFSTPAEFNTYLQSNSIHLVYPLAEPIHYPLTPTEIKTLLGQNNIWADTGDTEVEYRADTTLYIKRLTDSDTDMIADTNIVSGQYFMVGNDLYRATVNIASGASVIEGTNAVKISLAQALNEINA